MVRNSDSVTRLPLPAVHENGCYEIRLESIGGLGANLCGKLLGELGAVYLGLNAAAFSSYGSEKRGSGVKSYVRWSAREILHNSPVERPHLLVLFHSTLSAVLPVTAGVDENCTLVVNTDKTPSQMRNALRLYAGTVCCVNALELALESKSRINMVLLGAIAKASGFIPLDAVKTLVRDTLGKKYPAMLERNLEGIDLGFHGVTMKTFAPDERFPLVEYCESRTKWGYRNAPIVEKIPISAVRCQMICLLREKGIFHFFYLKNVSTVRFVIRPVPTWYFSFWRVNTAESGRC